MFTQMMSVWEILEYIKKHRNIRVKIRQITLMNFICYLLKDDSEIWVHKEKSSASRKMAKY